MRKLFVTVAFLFSCFTAYAQVGNRHFEYAGNFSICPPSNWIVQEVPGYKYKFFFGPETNGFTPNINVMDENYSGTLSEYVDLSIENFKVVFPDAISTTKEYFETASGLIGFKFITAYTFNTIKLTVAQYCFSNLDLKIIVTCAAPGSSLGNYFNNIYDQSVRTFQLIK
ncbi:MAG: hypothetical protein FWH41_05275 [Treponema sp.]|nr:hypothetical protein [Treponema sp.]